MKRFIGLLIVLVYAGSAMAEGFNWHTGLQGSDKQQQCYAIAMIGLDSVINAHLGVLPEQIVELNMVNTAAAKDVVQYQSIVLNVMLAAYLWEGSPHSYAVQVFFDCANGLKDRG